MELCLPACDGVDIRWRRKGEREQATMGSGLVGWVCYWAGVCCLPSSLLFFFPFASLSSFVKRKELERESKIEREGLRRAKRKVG